MRLAGYHRRLCPLDPEFLEIAGDWDDGDDMLDDEILADPLEVASLRDVMMQVEAAQLAEGEGSLSVRLIISDSDELKVVTPQSHDDGYFVELGSEGLLADVPFLLNEGPESTFVNYLRRGFRWGGFPGWERYEKPPRSLLRQLSPGSASD